jgi:hypothetical protein
MRAGWRSAGPARWTVRGAVVAALLVPLSVLSGCASIPRTGPVVPGRAVNADPRAGIVQVVGFRPVPGATPEGIVSGFLGAAAGFGDDHEVARSYLTPQVRLAWRPDASVKIYQNGTESVQEVAPKPTPSTRPTPSPSEVPGGSSADVRDRVETTKVVVKVPLDATIDRDGRYTLVAPGKTSTTPFTLTRAGGQWRISELPDGILINSIDFGVTFRPFPVYFADPTRRFLVPDIHWFPGTRDQPESLQLPTALVRVLLQGPPRWLKDSVVTGAPDGTRMAVAAVVVSDDVATVDLTNRVRDAGTRDRQLLASQLQATLSPLQIGSVQITVHQTAFDVPAGSGGPADENDPSRPDGQPIADPQVESRPVVIDAKGRLARLNGSTPEPVKDVAALAVPGVNRPAVSSDSTAYAVLNGDRSRLLLQMPGAKMLTLVTSAALTAPSFDPQGWVWTAPGANTGFVYAGGPASAAVKVKAPWMNGLDVVGMRVSRDGTRAAVVSRSRGVAHLFLSGVQRDADGKPESLSQPIGLFPDLRTARDVAWVDEDAVVVLGQRASATGEGPWVVQIGGTIRAGIPGTPVVGAESITAGNGEQFLMAGSRTGVLARSGAVWAKVSTARWPAFPG